LSLVLFLFILFSDPFILAYAIGIFTTVLFQIANIKKNTKNLTNKNEANPMTTT